MKWRFIRHALNGPTVINHSLGRVRIDSEFAGAIDLIALAAVIDGIPSGAAHHDGPATASDRARPRVVAVVGDGM